MSTCTIVCTVPDTNTDTAGWLLSVCDVRVVYDQRLQMAVLTIIDCWLGEISQHVESARPLCAWPAWGHCHCLSCCQQHTRRHCWHLLERCPFWAYFNQMPDCLRQQRNNSRETRSCKNSFCCAPPMHQPRQCMITRISLRTLQNCALTR